jgi:hypothetical protein
MKRDGAEKRIEDGEEVDETGKGTGERIKN